MTPANWHGFGTMGPSLIDELYAKNQKRWFETIAHYNPANDLQFIFDEIAPVGWTLDRQALWFVAKPPNGKLEVQGWKIHISSPTSEAPRVLGKVLPILFEKQTFFKFVADLWLTGEINGKVWPREAAGKFITIYPGTLNDFMDLGFALAQELRDVTGPYILSDRRWPGSKAVYYRYGGFINRSVLSVEGFRKQVIEDNDGELVFDERTPYWNVPSWIRDPHRKFEPQTNAASEISLQDRYRVVSALSFSSRGGVYEAYDQAMDRSVVLKEARPFVEVGIIRANATDVLKNEYSILRKLEGAGYFVGAMDLFWEGEHLYLVEQHLPGDNLGRFTIAHNPLYSCSANENSGSQYLLLMAPIWLQIAKAIKSAHERGIVIGDLSVNNIIVNSENAIKIIDLESANDGNSNSIGLFTPGFALHSSWTSGVADQNNDIYALGGIIFGCLFLGNNLINYYPPALNTFLEHLTIDLNLPDSLVKLVRAIYNQNIDESLSIDRVIDSLQQISIECESSKAIFVTSPYNYKSDEAKQRLKTECRETVAGVVQYLNRTADLSREDRLFPSDMEVFSTNPLSVAYGAAGVVYALRLLTGDVKTQFVDWILKRNVTNAEFPPGLYTGIAGIAWVLDEIGRTEDAVKLYEQSRDHQLLWESANVLEGAAGYGLFCLKLWYRRGIKQCLSDAQKIGDWLLSCPVQEEQGVRWATSDGVRHVGYAKGGSGIALFLLLLSLASNDEKYARTGRHALDFEIAQAKWLGQRFLGFPNEVGSETSPYWIAGTAGIVTTMLRYYVAYGDEELLQHIKIFERDLTYKYAKFPQLFMGLAGLGNCLLDLSQFLGDEKYLKKAWHSAEGILLHRVVREEGVTFPGTRALRESADFSTGASGVALFLHRLLQAEQNIGNPVNSGNFNFMVDELLKMPSRSW